MPKVHSKFSTQPPLESLWWRTDITKEDIRWVRQHLGRSLDGIGQFDILPSTVCLTAGRIPPDWRHRVRFFKGEAAPRVQIPLGEMYDYRKEYERARQEGDPHLSPHGLFRELENGFHEHAMQFMQQFGALTWNIGSGSRGDTEWVNLQDFWDRHTRFVGVMQLWESRFDESTLRQSWRWIFERLNRINRVAPANFGSLPNWNVTKYHRFPGSFPWEVEGIEEGLEISYSSLLQTTHEIVHYELNLHTQECRQIWTMQSLGHGQDVRFEPIRSYESLWGAIWDLFGQDICTLTHGWRVCLECGRRFYPKDHRSLCCTSKHQALWSKRKWAREHRKSRVLSKPKS